MQTPCLKNVDRYSGFDLDRAPCRAGLRKIARIPQRVILIDGRRRTELMVEHGVGARFSRVLEFKRHDEDFFSED